MIGSLARLLAPATALLLGMVGSAGAQSTTKFGVLTAQSGPYAAAGAFELNGLKLGVDTLNETGGIEVAGSRRRVELVVYDTHCNSAEASAATQRLASVDEVAVILGEVCTPAALTEAPIASDNGTPIIFTLPSTDSITAQKLPFVFRVNATQIQTNEALARFIASVNYEPLGFLAWNNDAGRAGVKLMQGFLPKDYKYGYIGYFNNGDVDFHAQIANLRQSGARAVMLLMDEEPGSLAIRQIRESGLDIQLIGTLAMGSDRFLKRLDAPMLKGMIQYNAFPPNARIPRVQEFAERYRKAFKEEAHGWAANAYDGVMVAADAIRRAGSFTDRGKINATLKTTDWDGVSGKIRFGDDGQAHPPVFVTQWCDNGTRSILYPPEYVAGCGNG
jgi:branched-chain amino acid transport system substrate-binding protein